MALLTLEEIANKAYKREKESPVMIEQYKETVSLKNVASGLWYDNEKLAIYELNKNHLNACRQRFFNCGWLDEYCINHFNSRFLDYGLHHICYAILSDNEEMIQRYAKLRYKTKYIDGRTDKWKDLTMDEMVLDGEGALFCNTIQFFMENNSEGIERNLNIYELKKVKILRTSKTGELDFEFFNALYTGNKGKMEEILEKFLTPRIHKYRTNDIILDKFISLPALGYAKLAWRKGIEVEVKSKLVPKELLPIVPNEHYDIPYDFLK